MYNLDVEEHDTYVDVGNTVEISTEVVCRGCLKTGGEMKNLNENDLDKDFFKYTGIPNAPLEGLPEHLCEECEADLKRIKTFKEKCEKSDKTVRAKILSKKTSGTADNRPRIKTVINNKKLMYFITAPNPNDKITLKCPNVSCKAIYYKNNLLLAHLKKAHKISENYELELRYFCTEKGCAYYIDLKEPKYFSGRKYFNQHYSKIHDEKKFSCESCSMKFAKLTDYHRHTKSCSLVYTCTPCGQTYNSNESYLVHLMRKHPDLHAKYKDEKKAQKRLPETVERLPEVVDNETPMKIRKDSVSSELEIKSVKEKSLEHNIHAPSTSQFQYPPVQSSMDILLSAILADTRTVAYKQSLVETTSKESIPVYQAEVLTGDARSEEYTTIKEESFEGTSPTVTVNVQTTNNKQDEENGAKKYIMDEPQSEETSNEIDTVKKSFATQMPEDLTSDISLTSWPTKTDFEIQNEMSTQTMIEDWLLTGCEVFESVSLSDIETQTAPEDIRLSHKETQSSPAQTQLPDISIKETQTCVCRYDDTRPEVRHFDLISSPNPNNLTSTETQTNDFVSSDVLLSFSSAQTQTNFEESNDNM